MNNQEELFEIKQKFLRIIPHPKLIKKQIDKLDRLSSIKVVESEIVEPQLSHSIPLVTYLDNYINIILQLRLKIANAPSPIELKSNLDELLVLQESFIRKLASYIDKFDKSRFEFIKMSDDFDAFGVLKFIRNENIEENKIKPYLYNQIIQETRKDTPLLIACIRAKKILEYDR